MKEVVVTKKDPSKELACRVREILLNKKAENVLALDIRGLSSIADYFVIASGTSTRHVIAMSDDVELSLKKEGVKVRGIEGREEGTWVLIDYNDVIVHLFHHETRDFYQLEKIWGEAPRVS